MTSSGINQHVDVWQRELVFRTGFIEVSKVDTTPYLAVLLLNRNDVSEACWMLDRLDEVDVE